MWSRGNCVCMSRDLGLRFAFTNDLTRISKQNVLLLQKY